ncbi:hypothetical protein TWF718_007895 [Orbilia javanica]|uniref:Uncharacterized protein n=1 Tax=Orbilia javanica TaxID=47235 RepID=A0AAN8RC08_9PEZI
MSNMSESFVNYGLPRIQFPPSLNAFFALKIWQLCRICLTFALVDERQASRLLVLDAILSALMELALACDKPTTRKSKRLDAPVDECGERPSTPASNASPRNPGAYPSGSRSPTRNSTVQGGSVKSKKQRSRTAPRRSSQPSLGSRTDSRRSAASPYERFLSLQDFQRQADIGRLVGEELLCDDWEQELLLEPGYNRIGMKVQKPTSGPARSVYGMSSRRATL